MPDYAEIIRLLNHMGFSSYDIQRWGKTRGDRFSAAAVRSVLQRGSIPRKGLRGTLEDLKRRLID